MICCQDRRLSCSSRTLQNLFLPWFTFIVWGTCSASFLCFLCYIVTLCEWFVNIVLSTDVLWIGSIGINNTFATYTVAHRQLSPQLMLCSPATSTPNWPLSWWPLASGLFSTRNKKSLRYIAVRRSLSRLSRPFSIGCVKWKQQRHMTSRWVRFKVH